MLNILNYFETDGFIFELTRITRHMAYVVDKDTSDTPMGILTHLLQYYISGEIPTRLIKYIPSQLLLPKNKPLYLKIRTFRSQILDRGMSLATSDKHEEEK